MDDRLQITNNYVAGGMRFETKAQWQRHSLTEVSDDCQPAPGQTTCTKVKDQVAFGLVLNTGTLDVLAHQPVGEHLTGTLGVSGMYQLSGTSGPIFLVPGATTTAGGAFSFEQLTFGKISFVTGLRVFRHRQTDARLTGAEFSASIDVSDPLTVRVSHDFVNGSDRTTGAPIPLMPPPRTIIGANLHASQLGWAQRASIGAKVEINETQTRLD